MKWLNGEVEKLKQLADSGIKYKEISIILDRSETAIAQKLNTLNMSRTSKWTSQEIKLLKEKYETHTTEELVKIFSKHTLGSIDKKALELGLKRKNVKRPKWTSEEIKKLKNLVDKKYNDKEMAEILGRSYKAVKEKRQQCCKEYFTWSETEVTVLKEKYRNVLIKGLLLLLPNKTENQIQKKANNIGLYKPPSLLWNEEDVKMLKKEYPHKIIEELQIVFPDKMKQQINKKAKRLKLRKTKETLARCFRTEIDKIPKTPSKRTSWRLRILKRDKYCCQQCNCKDKTGLKLQAHHIKPVRDCNNKEKYNIDNGICLCLDCHIDIKNKEYEHINYFIRRR